MKIDRFHLLAAALLILSLIQYKAFGRVIEVRDQNQFNRMSSSINQALKEGDKYISVNIQKGLYYFSECHLLFENLNFPDVSISIKGHDALVVSSGNTYSDGAVFNHSFDCANSFLALISDEKGLCGIGPYDFMGNVFTADGPVKVLDETTGLCVLPFQFRSFIPDSHDDIHITLSQWFTSGCHKVERITQDSIYFRVKNLSFNKRYNDYDVNGDYFYGKQNPQFRVCNHGPMADGCSVVSQGHIHIVSHIDSLHECTASRFVFFKNCNFKSISLDSLNVFGNSDNKYFLMDFANIGAQNVEIFNCSFTGMKSKVARFLNCPNVSVADNSFIYNFLDCIIIEGDSHHSIVSGNTFRYNGKEFRNSFCVRCNTEDYHIFNNTFVDFGYSAVGVGLSHYETGDRKSYGVVENNEIYYTEFYDIANILPMDSGAIYLFTKNDGAVIRYNYIHDITGRKDNRGIFCDDGASDFKIYGNIVLGIKNSYCIDSRLVSSDKLVNKSLKTNVNNYIGENLIDGSVRFEYIPILSNCRKSKNYSLKSLSGWPYKTIMSSFLNRIK